MIYFFLKKNADKKIIINYKKIEKKTFYCFLLMIHPSRIYIKKIISKKIFNNSDNNKIFSLSVKIK